ncbi:hypothetical protein FE257_009742 [Aspergillus nanangensis]|uniref:Aminoglycoside phosphotransferase domain-containing protein n=1 Tax=Aspergillus nanangensis TaxID=2582783 RepID=A0AAD4CJE4_ASPNN|nr:hypothetical protein FE257_009742 [Aspergillus nanangensis]
MTDEAIQTAVLAGLANTPYACTSATQLSGGTANFVYRGILTQPLPDGTTCVVIKHTEDFVASNRNFKISAERCLIEESILKSLNDFPVSIIDTKQGQVTVKTPRLYSFDPTTNTQVMEELPDSLDLKSFFTTPGLAHSREWPVSIGLALGNWLRSFHDWGDKAAQAGVKKEMATNVAMRDIKFTINYDNLVGTVARYPGLLESSRGVFEQVRDMARADNDQSNTPLFIIDWELTHSGARALDLGQMIAELYELTHFKGKAGTAIIRGFTEGYANINDDMAFRTAIHVGTHLICWGTTVAGWGSEEQIEDLVRIGRDLVVKGWEKDRDWFVSGFWECLFRDREGNGSRVASA